MRVKKSNIQSLTFDLIVFLENQFKPKCMGLEVSFLNNKRRADVFLLSKNQDTYAFEIKSDYDNIKKLDSQIYDYQRIFDYTYVVTTKKHVDKILNNVFYKNIGILLYDNQSNNFKKLQKPSRITEFKKEDILSFFGKQSSYKENSDISELKRIFIEKLCEKLYPLYEDFKEYFSPPYNIEQMLSLKSSKSILDYENGF